MPRFAVAAVGADQSGIVAAVTGVFVEQGCNLQDTAMTILGGHFAMMMVIEATPGTSGADLEAALLPVASRLELLVMVRGIPDEGGRSPAADQPATGQVGTGQPGAGEHCTVSVYGADRPGIVHGIASLLAEQGINIVDLTTRVVGTSESPVYAMVLEVDIPAAVDLSRLTEQLDGLAQRMGVSASVHPSEADIL